MPRMIQPSGAKKRQAVKQKHEKDDAVNYSQNAAID